MVPCFHLSSVLHHLPSLLLLLQLPLRGSTEQFLVIGPSDPIIAVLGRDVTLPCYLDPVMSAENMELRWFRSHFSESVLIYQDQQEWKEEQMPQYRGRTSLMKELLSEGQAAVRIHKVQASDNGLYTCFFRDGVFYEQASLELKVAGVGSAPQVYIMGPEEDGVRVVCTALGWFPKPQVQWTDPNGEKFLTLSEVQDQDHEGLFSMKVALVVRDSSVGSVTCSILNPILGQEKAMTMVIPEPFFPRASPWKPAFLVSLSLLLLLLLGAACYTWREHSTCTQELQKQRSLYQAKEEDKQTKEEVLKDRDEFQKILDQRKAAYLTAWRKAQLYADWRKEQFQAWSVTLDPDSAHPVIVLSHDKKSLACQHYGLPRDMTVLGHNGITSERHYWEVEVTSGEKSWWGLGVWREDEKTRKKVPSHSKGFWFVGRRLTEITAYTDPRTPLPFTEFPHRVGIFLDYDQGDISFYNMTDGSHIYSFPPASFSGTLFPFFVCYVGDISMTICPLKTGPQKPSVLIKDPPTLGDPVGPSGERFLSSSGVDGAPPGPGDPLLPCTPEIMYP